VRPRPARRIAVVLALGVALLLPSSPALAERGSYHGRVIEAGTGAPLPGAVVAVIWMKAPFFSMDGVKDFHEARETLTDAEGRFSIDATPRWALRAVDRRPEIIVFKPGYGRYPDMYRKIDWPGRKAFELVEEPLQARQAATVELPRLTARRDAEPFTSPSLHLRVPDDALPIYRRLVNEHAVKLGITPLPDPPGQPSEREKR
jgi:hypothetical protein